MQPSLIYAKKEADEAQCEADKKKLEKDKKDDD